MPKLKRKKFFIKGNFRFNFIIAFTFFLFIDILIEYFFIYQFSKQAIDEAIFKSHININKGAQIIWPIIAKINIYGVLITIIIAAIILSIIYHRMNILFKKIISGLNRLKDHDASIRIILYGSKNTREILKEFNHAACCLERQMNELQKTIDCLIQEKDFGQIKKLHNQLVLRLSGKIQKNS